MRFTDHVVHIPVPPASDAGPTPHTHFQPFENFLDVIIDGFARRVDARREGRLHASEELTQERSRSYAISLDADTAEEAAEQLDFIQWYFSQEAALMELTAPRATTF